ncbi:MAG: alkaline phosphatase family protein [Deltaproteobacteria bacterium]|nr:alkaline phosphatase family protein [Deltaproteobacteria bacterium]
MTRLVLLAALVLACRTPPRVPSPAKLAQPRLVVLIVVDQLPSWLFERDRSVFRGGFDRLLREGGYVRRGELPFANTFTAPGHATIGTGAVPRTHGIHGNLWWRRDQQRDRSAEWDPEAPILPIVDLDKPLPVDVGASARALRVTGIADALRSATQNRARTIAIGLKPRAACFLAGRQPELAVWFDAAAGGMTTSRAYTSTAPPWLVELAKTKPPSRFIGQTWTPLDPVYLARQTQIADDAPGEGGLHGMGVAFPHLVHDFEELLHTPFADELVLDTATAALDAMQLGTDEVPDLLAISLNAHDYAGHNWGPDSWEVLDLTMRLDTSLGAFFTLLDRKLGKDGWAAVLTSDHGATHVVDRSPVTGAKRFSPSEIAKEGGPMIAKVSSNQAYMTPAWAQLPPAQQQAARTAAANAIRKRYPEIDVFDTSDASHCKERSLAGEVCRGLVEGLSGELYLAPKRGFVITEYPTGTHHDAPNPDNQHVPILVRAPGLAPQMILSASILQVAPTVAALLGVPPPEAATEKPLFEIEPRSRARP